MRLILRSPLYLLWKKGPSRTRVLVGSTRQGGWDDGLQGRRERWLGHALLFMLLSCGPAPQAAFGLEWHIWLTVLLGEKDTIREINQ